MNNISDLFTPAFTPVKPASGPQPTQDPARKVLVYHNRELLIEIERFASTFVYWCYGYTTTGRRKLHELGYQGMDELPEGQGHEMIARLKNCKALTVNEIY